MVDKTFNEKPMLVVVSDALDPRTKRQLQSQLQSELMTISEVDAEVKNAQSMENIKQQYDSNKDASEFDENDTKDEAPPKPIEQDQQDDSNKTPDQTNGSPSTDGQSGGEDPFTGEGNGSDGSQGNSGNAQESGGQPDANTQADGGATQGTGQSSADAFSADGAANQGAQQEQAGQKQPAQADQSQQTSSDDPFSGESGQAQNQETGSQNQQASNNQQTNTQQQSNQGANGSTSDDTEGDDPFSENQPTFEAFAGILGIPVKFESAKKQTTEENLPPMKQLTVITGSDRGVDDRTNGVIAALEDPQNTVVVLDISDVSEAEAKMQFQAVKRQLQERGITVTDTIDEAIDYLNDVYDQIAGKGDSAE